jgi:outer membrane receptor for monomeric catechols
LSYPYNPGPDTVYNLTGKWDLTDRITLFGRAGYFSSQKVICPRCETLQSVPGAWLLDAKLTCRDVWTPGVDLEFFVWNLADKDYLLPGTYSTIEGEPFETLIMISKRW